MNISRYKDHLIYLFLSLLAVGFYFLTTGPIWAPLQGSGDVAGWEYSGYYVFENLSWKPWPWLSFDNNNHFYPGGITPVFLSWGLERDFFFATLYRLFGLGPWLFLYFGLSHLFLSLASFGVAKKYLGAFRSLLLSLFVTYLNVYALHKYPGHYGLSVHHWASLSILIDFLLLKRFVENREINLFLLLARTLATFGSLSLELGYIGGLSLSSFVFLIFYAAIHSLVYWKREGVFFLSLSSQFKEWVQEYRSRPLFYKAFGGFICAYVFIFFPPLLSIMLEIKANQSDESASGAWFTRPERLFLPLIQPYYNDLAARLKDIPEGYPAGTVGWFVLFSGLFGFFLAMKRKKFYVLPFFAFILMIASYNPSKLNPLSVLPWFSYARVGPRLTLAYPALFGVLAVAVPWFSLKSIEWKKLLFVAALLGVLALEMPMMYGPKFTEPPFAEPPKEFFSHMSAIRAEDGEALFDFPYCYTGGNGGGYCPYYQQLGAIWANRKFHSKKVMGTYFGRLSSKHGTFYRQYGLDQIMSAQTVRCLEQKEVTFLLGLFNSYDFAAMNIYAGVLPQGCRGVYKKVLGEPDLISEFPSIGQTYLYKRSSLERRNLTKLKASLRSYVIFNHLQRTADFMGADKIYVYPDLFAELKIFMPFAPKELFAPLTDHIERLSSASLSVYQEERTPAQQIDSALYFLEKVEGVFVYKNGGRLKQKKSASLNFVSRIDRAMILNQLDFKLRIDVKTQMNEIYIHPTLQPARIEFSQIKLHAGDQLRFGIKLDHEQGNAIFKIKVDEQVAFAKKLDFKATFQNLTVDLDSYLKAEKDDYKVVFEIDPNGSQHFVWTSWIDPVLLRENQDS